MALPNRQLYVILKHSTTCIVIIYAFCRWHFQIPFLEWIHLYIHLNFTKICFNLQKAKFDSGNGMAQNRGKVTTSANVDPDILCHMVSSWSHNELNCLMKYPGMMQKYELTIEAWIKWSPLHRSHLQKAFFIFTCWKSNIFIIGLQPLAGPALTIKAWIKWSPFHRAHLQMAFAW